jgi:hypothetical protein
MRFALGAYKSSVSTTRVGSPRSSSRRRPARSNTSPPVITSSTNDSKTKTSLLEVLNHRIGSPKLAEPIEHSCDDRPTDGGVSNDDAAPDDHEGPTDRLSGEHHQTTEE